MEIIETHENAALECIEVDDAAFSEANWTGTNFSFDLHHTFSEECSPCSIGDQIAANFLLSSRACSGDQVRIIEYGIFSDSTNGIQFNWDFGNGQTSTERDPVVTFNDPGSYNILLTMSNVDCAQTIVKRIDVSSCLIESGRLTSYSKVFPNPTIGTLKLSVKLSDYDNVTATIYDFSGNMIFSKYYPEVIDLNDEFELLTKGLYNVEIRHSFGIERHKVLVLR